MDDLNGDDCKNQKGKRCFGEQELGDEDAKHNNRVSFMTATGPNCAYHLFKVWPKSKTLEREIVIKSTQMAATQTARMSIIVSQVFQWRR